MPSYVSIRETDFTITFPTGSEIIFMGLDDEEKLLSLTDISSVWVEEAFQVEKNKLEQLNLRMRGSAANQQLILSWNPISKYSYLYDFTVENPPANSIYHHSTYKDNPFLPDAYVEALDEMAVRNPQKYKVFGLGEWGINSDGLIYQNWRIECFNHAEINGALMVGLDFGFINDISAITAALMVEEEKRIYIFKEWGATGKTNQDLVEVITDLGFSKSVIIADCAEQKSVEEIKRGGISKIRACKKTGGIIYGIQQLQNYELVIHPSCKGVIQELESYSWEQDKNTGAYTNKPVDAHNHYLDALRYSLQTFSAKLKSLDNNLF
jgi:phage terminase large subunit